MDACSLSPRSRHQDFHSFKERFLGEKQEMLFQSYYHIDPWSFVPPIGRLLPTHISLGDDAHVQVELEKPLGSDESALLLIATLRTEPTKEQIDFLEKPVSLLNKRKSLPSYDDSLTGFPPDFIRFTRNLEKELDSLSTHVLQLIGWKNKVFGGPHRLECNLCHMRWAREDEDKIDDKFLRRQYPMGSMTLKRPEIWEGTLSIDMVNSESAPLYYELLNDGIRTITTSPRSSLVILVAAIETAIKHYVTAAVPDAGWLIENMPSPPLFKLLSSYLEQLPAINHHLDKCLRIPKTDLKVIQKSVEKRNRIVHGKEANLTADLLEEVQRVATETLYYFDWLQGDDWAYEYISEQLKGRIQLDK
jgi:hypothetical protein